MKATVLRAHTVACLPSREATDTLSSCLSLPRAFTCKSTSFMSLAVCASPSAVSLKVSTVSSPLSLTSLSASSLSFLDVTSSSSSENSLLRYFFTFSCGTRWYTAKTRPNSTKNDTTFHAATNMVQPTGSVIARTTPVTVGASSLQQRSMRLMFAFSTEG